MSMVAGPEPMVACRTLHGISLSFCCAHHCNTNMYQTSGLVRVGVTELVERVLVLQPFFTELVEPVLVL